ncbi:MAG TPA: hypothetical protein VEJ39_09010 [Candidatus Acidoferrales bacterium]|nr:hypothetical protein [Candidatus Acidoferrales bacterium]
MAKRKLQVGQLWKKEGSGETFLITKIYSEALATYAVLRRTGAETEAPVRVRVQNGANGQDLPGFTFAQESNEF